MQFWLSYNNGAERLRLPVNPEIIGISSSHGYTDVEVTQLGEYTIIGGAKLQEYTLSSLFPRDYNASYCEYDGFPTPWETVSTIERWKESGSPIRLTVTGTPLNVAVTIRSFTYEERGGEPGDLYYELQLKEYVFIKFAKVEAPTATAAKVKSAKSTANARSTSRTVPASVVVKAGDSLFKISARVYGDGDKWRTIYNANKAAVGANPNVIKVGVKLTVPPL